MKTKKLLLSLLLLLVNAINYSQQIGDGLAPIVSDFTIPLKSGVYSGLGATGSTPDNSYGNWQHLLVIRHPNINNNHQLQVASSYASNDRLFFRKIAADLSPSNPSWVEIATRGANTFNGTQTINGSQVVNGGLSASNSGEVGPSLGLINPSKTSNGQALRWNIYNMSGGYGNSLQFWAYDNLGCVSGGLCAPRMTLMDNGNVGIGTTAPDEKLTVKGKIHAQEVKVDLQGACAADYVFQKYYTGKSELKADYVMPTLAEIESFTKKNHHLPNVPSAKEIQQNGLLLGQMSNVLLQKVEELTLYAIEQNKVIEELKAQVTALMKKSNN
jgi:hypothetical protein